ncbi:MAG: hypothetical protein AABY66_04420, partial [Nitrospirota bacterium]
EYPAQKGGNTHNSRCFCNLFLVIHSKTLWLTHPHPVPPLEGEGNSLSLRERVRVRVGIFITIVYSLLIAFHSLLLLLT